MPHQQSHSAGKSPLTLNHDTQVRPAEGAVGVLSNLDLALRVDEEHGWLWERVLSLPDVARVAHIQAPSAHVSQLEAVGNAVGDLLGLCGGTQAVQLHRKNIDSIHVGWSQGGHDPVAAVRLT